MEEVTDGLMKKVEGLEEGLEYCELERGSDGRGAVTRYHVP